MLQVLGREIIETQQGRTVLDQALDKLVVLHAAGFDEEIKSALGYRPGVCQTPWIPGSTLKLCMKR